MRQVENSPIRCQQAIYYDICDLIGQGLKWPQKSEAMTLKIMNTTLNIAQYPMCRGPLIRATSRLLFEQVKSSFTCPTVRVLGACVLAYLASDGEGEWCFSKEEPSWKQVVEYLSSEAALGLFDAVETRPDFTTSKNLKPLVALLRCPHMVCQYYALRQLIVMHKGELYIIELLHNSNGLI